MPGKQVSVETSRPGSGDIDLHSGRLRNTLFEARSAVTRVTACTLALTSCDMHRRSLQLFRRLHTARITASQDEASQANRCYRNG